TAVASASRPSARIASAASAVFSCWMSARTTDAPSPASRSAMHLPMPCAAPVTIATCPWSSPSLIAWPPDRPQYASPPLVSHTPFPGTVEGMWFRTKVLQAGKTATGIEVPAKVVTAIGSSKRPAVRVTINGHTYRSTVATMDGKFMVGVSAQVREAAGVAGGDTVDVDIELDSSPREVTVPEDFAKALKRDAAARKLFEGLSYSR